MQLVSRAQLFQGPPPPAAAAVWQLTPVANWILPCAVSTSARSKPASFSATCGGGRGEEGEASVGSGGADQQRCAAVRAALAAPAQPRGCRSRPTAAPIQELETRHRVAPGPCPGAQRPWSQGSEGVGLRSDGDAGASRGRVRAKTTLLPIHQWRGGRDGVAFGAAREQPNAFHLLDHRPPPAAASR